MNIFILDRDPVKAAKMQCDAHVVKMVLETAQMLSTAARELAWDKDQELLDGVNIYKKAYVNHPCTVWARTSQENASWLCRHGLALAEEYTKRFGKQHKSKKVIASAWIYLLFVKQAKEFPKQGLTDFAQAMPDEYKNDNAVKAYRDYYLYEKTKLSKFSYSKLDNMPIWLNHAMTNISELEMS